MRATFTAASSWKRIVEGVKDLVQEANVHFSRDGLELQAMDVSNVALVFVRVETRAFATYDCPDPVTAGVAFGKLHKILSCVDNEHELTLALSSSHLDLIARDARGRREARFSLPLLEIDMEQVVVPEMSFDATCTMATDAFHRIVRDFAQLGDTLDLSATERTLVIAVRGESGQGRVQLSASDRTTLSVRNGTAPRLSLAMRYLSLFCKTTLSANVRLNMTSGLPLCLTHDNDRGVMARYYLAPRMDD